MQATQLWALWQDLLHPFARAFTPRGWPRFAEWLTGLALNAEEHTITQSLIGQGRPQDWKGLETFAEVGHTAVRYAEGDKTNGTRSQQPLHG
jgi:hypothetical protein